MTITEFEAALGEISLELPDELFNKLNGGVVVQPGEKLHKESLPGSPLYIAGEYVRAHSMRYIVIYYGSFMRLYGRQSDEAIKEHIRSVLLHELRHHWEGLSGERGLEIEDEENLALYLDSHVRQPALKSQPRPHRPRLKPEEQPKETPAPPFTYEPMPTYDGRVHTYGEDRK